MTADRHSSSHAVVSRTLFTGVTLGIVTLLACLAQPIFEFVHTVDGNKVLRSVHSTDLMSGQLLLDVVHFALALILVHVGVGLAAAFAGLASSIAFKRLRTTPPSQLTVLWFLAIMGWILVANSTWFPWSNAGMIYAGYINANLFGFSLVQLYSAALVAAAGLLTVAFGATLATRWRASRLVGAMLSLAIGAVILGGIANSRHVNAGESGDPAKPNVIVIGIDSLRLEQLAAFGGDGVTKNIDQFVASSLLFRDTITPIARTFPSWISILTGRYPDQTGARINLIERDAVDAEPTLAEILRRSGYSTVFATDEVRFSNIDQSYGFDDVITPKIGAADFLLGMFNDFPVSNVLANTRVARVLFPHTYANRAAASRYSPDTFVEMLDREFRPSGPTFVAIHLTMPHWPYLWSDAPKAPRNLGKKEAELWVYRNGLAVADQQFGEVMHLLTERGVMDNAIVIVLSDHGEALFQPGDRLIPNDVADIPGATRPVEVSTFGHGSSVLSPVQFQVLLAFGGTGQAAALIRGPESSHYPATLVDLAPTLLGLLGIGADTRFDGINLFPTRGNSGSERIRFTETEFNLPMVIAGQPDPGALALQAAEYYTVDPASGWLEFRHEKLGEIDSRRERAAVSEEFILAALPTLEGNSRFVLADRKTGSAELVENTDTLPEKAAGLWIALQEKYGGHLGPPTT